MKHQTAYCLICKKQPFSDILAEHARKISDIKGTKHQKLEESYDGSLYFENKHNFVNLLPTEIKNFKIYVKFVDIIYSS